MRLTEPTQRSLTIVLASFLILANALLHAQVYGNRNYRQDEIFITRLSSIYSMSSLVLDTADDPAVPGWRLLVDFWLDSFGLSEEITRWLSKLTNIVTSALIFQLGKQICCRRVGLYAVVLLGVYGFAASAMYELRPYPFLVTLVTALHLFFFRWMRKPSSALMFAYTLTGIAAIYTHFFSVFVFPAHAVCLVLFTRYERKLWLSSLVMWLAIGLSFLGWLLPFLQAILIVMPGGITYSIEPGWAGILQFYDQSKFQPELVYQFLMLLSLFAPSVARRYGATDSRMRFSQRINTLFPLILLFATILIAYAADLIVSNLSLRNVVMFAPLIAVSMALGMRVLSTKAALIILLLLMLHAPQNIKVRGVFNGPYREIAQSMSSSYQTDSVVVTDFRWAWLWLLPAAYYLMDFTPDKMSKHRMFHLVDPHDPAHPPNYPDKMVNIINTFYADTFRNQLPAHRQLWRLTQGGGNYMSDKFQEWLNHDYALIKTYTWDEPYLTSHTLSEYAKAPDHQGPIILAGDELQLYAWTLDGSVEVAACQSVTVESWWRINAEVDESYSLSVILADDGGQLAIQNSIPADVFTTEWETGRFYRDRTRLQIPCAIDEGRYNLLLAAKETSSGDILKLHYPDGNDIGNEYYLTTLQVKSS